MLSDADREILVDLLVNGDNSSGNIADNIERHPTTVTRRLKFLDEEMGYVVSKGRGVWRLTPKGLNAAQTINQHQS